MDGFQIAKDYAKGNLIGWAGYNNPQLVKDNFNLLVSQGFLKPKFNLLGQTEPYRGKKRFLYHAVRKVLGEDTKNYPQQVGDCLSKDSWLLMANGKSKRVNEILVGDTVLNHFNQPAKVIDLVNKLYTGNLIKIKIKGWKEEITLTETHKCLYMPVKGYRFKYKGFDSKLAKDLELGDYLQLGFGVDCNENDNKILDLLNYVSDLEYDDNFVWKNNSNKVKRFIKINSDFARLIGLYLAEGGCRNGRIQFSYSSEEVDFHNETLFLMKEIFGLDGKIKIAKETCYIVNCYSTVVQEFLKKLIPGDIYNKNVPDIFFLCGPVIKMSLLRGWLDGDGYISKKYNRLIGVSSSSRLISDIAKLALSCKLNPRTLVRKKSSHQRVAACQLDLYGKDTYTIYDKEKIKKKLRRLLLDRTPYGFARKIISIEKEYVKNYPVYCVTTDGEHTINVNGINFFNCVSFGAKNATEYLSCVQILVNGGMQFKNVFPPYYYGTGRVYVGGGRIGGDGSLGSWMASAVQKYGTLFVDDKDVPSYSGSVARSWGSSRSTLDKYLPTAQDNLVKSAALVRTWDDLVAAIVNGYPCTCASNVGFTMEANSQGFHRRRGSWAHQMCGTPYMTIDCVNPKYIKDVSIGDEIYSHNGKLLKVTDIYERDYDGKIAKIYVRGNLPLELTLNHPVLVSRKIEEQEISKSENSSILVVTNKRTNVWIKAGDIKEGDFIVSPVTDIPESNDIPKWKNNSKCKNKPEDFVFDDNLAWLFGLYIADGDSVKSHKVRITLGCHEKEIISKAINCISKLGLRSTITPVKNKNAIRINIYSSIVADSFIEWFGKKENKRIPNWLFNKKWNLKELLNGIFCGDGNFIEKSPNTKRIVNTSKVLINQIKNILLNLGYQPNISKRNNKSDYAKNWKDIYVIEWTEDPKKQQYNWWNNKELLKKVYKVEYIDYIGKVYNLEVEKDHSYLMEGLAVHNCFVGVDDEYSTPYALILNSWGDCVSEDTEILTENGWRNFKNLPKNLKVATLNRDNWDIEYQLPTNYFEFESRGYLNSIKGRDIDLLITDNHNIYHCEYNKDKRNINNWKLQNFDSLNKHLYIKKDGNWIGEEKDFYEFNKYKIKMDLWLEFLGYFLSEGYTNICKRTKIKVSSEGKEIKSKNGFGRKVGITQTKEKTRNKIINLCKKLPFNFHVTKAGVVFGNNKILYNELVNFGKANEKFIPDYVKNLSKRQLRILFDSLMDGDGSISKCKNSEKCTYYTSSKTLANDVQELCLKIGYAADISFIDRIGRKGKKGGTTRFIEYRVGIKRYSLMQHVVKENIIMPYQGKTYCVEVPNHTIYVRRNGKACWIGNSHGHLKDFETSENLPVGILRVPREDAESILRASETFAFSQFDGFPEQKLDKYLFNVF